MPLYAKTASGDYSLVQFLPQLLIKYDFSTRVLDSFVLEYLAMNGKFYF